MRALQAKNEAEKSGKEKVADKPHKWTAMSWFIGPVVAAASIVFSVWMSNRAIRVNETSMKISQRAYIAVRNTRISMKRTVVEGTAGVQIDQDFEVHNLGNTPGTLIAFARRAVAPDGWSMRPNKTPNEKKDEIFEDVSRGETIHRHFVTQFIMVREAANQFDDAVEQIASAKTDIDKAISIGLASSLMVVLRNSLDYTDVFGEHHSADWDEQVSVSESNVTDPAEFPRTPAMPGGSSPP